MNSVVHTLLLSSSTEFLISVIIIFHLLDLYLVLFLSCWSFFIFLWLLECIFLLVFYFTENTVTYTLTSQVCLLLHASTALHPVFGILFS